jgi:hypothetical protein
MINEFGSDDMESFDDLCINCDVCFVSSMVECVRIKKMGFPGIHIYIYIYIYI